ncbi:probable salivary secreted peptide [Culicoides brevitarsis]|uniref:probable salivary secreted peptide n=1 Tax=Culicoides brevitarsis TaxID=469753 RepID=UPI00307C54EB
MTRVLKSILLLCALIGAIHATTLIMGNRVSGDVLLLSQIRARKASNVIQSEMLEYKGTRNITYIRALDNFINGTGGYATVVSGGLYAKNVTLRLASSAANRGYNFTVELYGK